ncbi:MAG: hypothetical protein ACT4NL_11570 [Pseudomarimonas sp.]
MLDSVELHQVPITLDEVPLKLALAADGIPQTGYHALRGDGVGWFAELWALIRNDIEWVTRVRLTLADFLANGTTTRCQFAVAAAGVAADAVEAAAILASLPRQDIDDAIRADIALLCNQAILETRLHYSQALRPWVASPTTRGNLMAAGWVFDHDWLIEHLPTLLPTDPRDAAFCCAMALAQLRRAEWDHAVIAIHAARAALGDPRTDAILSRLTRSEANVDWTAAHRHGPRRWIE